VHQQWHTHDKDWRRCVLEVAGDKNQWWRWKDFFDPDDVL
jgi:hypothetical protein